MTKEDIEHEIERTRDEMTNTLNAIERKLSPKQIMDQAVDTMRELASDQSRIAQMVRENPIPLALIGLGIGWVAVSGSMGRKSSAAVKGGSYESMEGLSPSWGGAPEGGGGYGYDPGVESPVYGTAGSAEYTAASASSLRERAGQVSGQAGERVARIAESTKGQVSQWGGKARRSANQAANRTTEAYQDHPLTMGLVALLVGAAVGALLPRSRAEAQTVGTAAGDALRQARQAGTGLMGKAGRVVERAAQAAKDEGERAYRQEAKPSDSPSTMTH